MIFVIFDSLCGVFSLFLDSSDGVLSVFNLERAIAPLAPFKGNWRKFDVYWGRNGALRIL